MEYLSDEWFDAADAALRHASPAPIDLVIDQHVDGVVSWRVVMGATCSIRRLPVGVDDTTGPTETADAVFRQSLDTAEAIARGSTDSHQAFLVGDVRFEGDIARVLDGRNGLTWLQQVLAPVMERTVWS